MKSDSHRGGNYNEISIFLPDEVWRENYTKEINPNVPHDYFDDYRNIDFSSATSWDNFIYSLYLHSNT